MSNSAVYRPHPEAPAQATLRSEAPSGAWEGLTAQRFELVSRGDFVPGVLYLPESAQSTPAPLLLLQHGTSEGMNSEALTLAAAWVEKGLAVATIDLPLHGERSSPKLSERLISGVGQLATGSKLDPETGALVEEFARQTTSDLIRTLDALTALPEIDGEHLGFMGFGVGAVAGSYLLAHDSRPRVAVLVHAHAGRGPGDLDPATYLAKASGVSILVVANSANSANAAKGEGKKGSAVSLASSDALFDSAPEPKEILRSSGKAPSLSDKDVAEIWRFLSKELGL